MAGFEHYAADTQEIELEIQRRGIILGIDWNDETQVRALAREALSHTPQKSGISTSAPVDYRLMAKLDLFGLAGLMLKTMEESAIVGIESHGGPVWKAFSKALWIESNLNKTGT
ncbi:MAG: hypothetical protein WAZ34_04685 [Rhodocyclaceae bacterium]